jgi:hypothetical protein
MRVALGVIGKLMTVVDETTNDRQRGCVRRFAVWPEHERPGHEECRLHLHVPQRVGDCKAAVDRHIRAIESERGALDDTTVLIAKRGPFWWG